jgi:integrase
VARLTVSEAWNEYEVHCVARGLAESTVRGRNTTILQLIDCIGDIQAWNITPRHVDKVFAENQWSVGTRNNKLTHYKAFFGWCRARGYMSQNSDPLFGWRVVKVKQPEKTRIPHHEWARLFTACETQIERGALALGLYLFLRGSELKTIQLKHVHLQDSEIEIYRTKTREWDVMPISAELDTYLRQHLTWLAEQGVSQPEHYLLPTYTKPIPAKGRPRGGFVEGSGQINPNKSLYHPYRYIQNVLQRAGYPTFTEGEHTLRRSGARAYFDHLAANGYDGALRRVQSMLGHSSSMMTEVYLGLDLDRRQRNSDIKGKPMFGVQDANIVPIRGVSNGA